MPVTRLQYDRAAMPEVIRAFLQRETGRITVDCGSHPLWLSVPEEVRFAIDGCVDVDCIVKITYDPNSVWIYGFFDDPGDPRILQVDEVKCRLLQ